MWTQRSLLDAYALAGEYAKVAALCLGQARGASKSADKESLARAAGLYHEAEPLLLKAYEGLKQWEKALEPRDAPRLSEALDRLIELYTATHKPDEVKKRRAERAKYPQGQTRTPEKK